MNELHIRWRAEVSSTQDLARAAIAEADATSTVWVADFQKAGRGRREGDELRRWVAPPGSGLMLSLVLRPSVTGQELAALTLVAAVAIAECLRRETDLAVGLKWPNDLLVGERKLGGILTEAEISGDGTVIGVVMGIGINVNLLSTSLPAELEETATSVAIETGTTHDRMALMVAIVESVRAAADEFDQAGSFAPFRARFAALDTTSGRRVMLPGDTAETGVANAVDEVGRLVVELDTGGTRAVSWGEISFV